MRKGRSVIYRVFNFIVRKQEQDGQQIRKKEIEIFFASVTTSADAVATGNWKKFYGLA